MPPTFDPYHKWLSIPPAEQPPNHYRLLGLALFESDPEVIEIAAERQIAHVRSLAIGPHQDLSQKLLNELAGAKLRLLDSDRKPHYDHELMAKLAAPEAGAKVVAAAVRSSQDSEPESGLRNTANGVTAIAEYPDFVGDGSTGTQTRHRTARESARNRARFWGDLRTRGLAKMGAPDDMSAGHKAANWHWVLPSLYARRQLLALLLVHLTVGVLLAIASHYSDSHVRFGRHVYSLFILLMSDAALVAIALLLGRVSLDLRVLAVFLAVFVSAALCYIAAPDMSDALAAGAIMTIVCTFVVGICLLPLRILEFSIQKIAEEKFQRPGVRAAVACLIPNAVLFVLLGVFRPHHTETLLFWVVILSLLNIPTFGMLALLGSQGIFSRTALAVAICVSPSVVYPLIFIGRSDHFWVPTQCTVVATVIVASSLWVARARGYRLVDLRGSPEAT